MVSRVSPGAIFIDSLRERGGQLDGIPGVPTLSAMNAEELGTRRGRLAALTAEWEELMLELGVIFTLC